ncbi:MAG: tetratricopeptide repeat protein [Okeania sp. SIO3B5]|uniref:tetratricopeptide repeat protein n=1 Tax=Okeania sp. SIO3B5 TaxID=2607811 RepID=UPI0014018EB5|nr:tetratricopeptide repeat protein [Okeania sp. SIO3B5]NEO55173.1 tetratricopeptide repeat protein [Okeania sp. SIO3B5]
MKEIKEVATFLEQKNYQQAGKLLKKLQKEHPQNLWVQLYIGRWYEEINRLESAEKFYRKLLKDATNPQVVAQARQGLQRIETIEKKRQQQAIATAKSDPKNTEPGLLIIEAISKENKQEAAKNLARIMKIDSYTARMQLQSKGWRIYRLGAIGELKVYGEEMLKAGIPVFWAKISDIEKINIFRIQYFQSISSSEASIVCLNEQDQMGSLNFQWSEVVDKVEGLLPIFMNAMDYDPRRRSEKIRHKQMTQDYANILDLHLPNRRSIIRFCDQNYQYQKGIAHVTNTPKQSPSKLQTTNRTKWNELVNTIDQRLGNIKTWSDFTPFGEVTSRDYTQLLSRLKYHIDISRKIETMWDPAFHLYSTLVFLTYSRRCA